MTKEIQVPYEVEKLVEEVVYVDRPVEVELKVEVPVYVDVPYDVETQHEKIVYMEGCDNKKYYDEDYYKKDSVGGKL